jgi:hypothetical protein
MIPLQFLERKMVGFPSTLAVGCRSIHKARPIDKLALMAWPSGLSPLRAPKSLEDHAEAAVRTKHTVTSPCAD